MSVTAPSGFAAAGVACGIKESGALDLALVSSEDASAVAAAAVFTSNLATAAPVQVSRRHLAATSGRASAVIVNSGNANACTGEAGRRDAERMCELVAESLSCAAEEVLVCSTGLIGIPMPVDRLESGIPKVVTARGTGVDAGAAAAEAMRTTDTFRKEVVRGNGGVTVGGMAKGAAMLSPDMATMLAVLTTDADLSPAELTESLRAGVSNSFNALDVDGCTSTNDTVILLASGRAGPPDRQEFDALVAGACADLAGQMARDAEGATKTVWVRVVGAASDEQARRAAREVAQSQLVKCSWYGQDAYWGRVVAELGAAGVEFDPERVAVSYGGITVAKDGVEVDHDRDAVAAHMAQRDIELVADLGLGNGTGQILTNDLTHAYVDENMGTS